MLKKVQLALTGSGPRAFQRAIDKPCTLSQSPSKAGMKRDFAVIASTIQLLSKEDCYKVSLCENFQRQSCTYTSFTYLTTIDEFQAMSPSM